MIKTGVCDGRDGCVGCDGGDGGDGGDGCDENVAGDGFNCRVHIAGVYDSDSLHQPNY